MVKKKSLTEALQDARNTPTHQEKEAPSLSTAPSSPHHSRQGKKIIAGHFDASVTYRMKRLALEKETTVQALLSEALDDLFQKYDVPVKEQ